MKNLIMFILFLFAFSVKSQETRKLPPKDTVPIVFIGGGTGVNNVCGMIGLVAGVKVTDNFFLRVGLGIGGWGTKFSAGFKYELKTTNSWGFGLSYSSCSGLKNFKTNLETVDSAKIIATRPVTVDLIRSSTINLTASYKWIFRNKNQFYVDFGYAVAIETDPYTIKDGSVLTSNGKAVLHILQPGGIIIGMGVLFGIQ